MQIISAQEYHDLALNDMQDFEVLQDHLMYPDGTPLPLLHELRYRWIIDTLIKLLPSTGCHTPATAATKEAAVAKVASLGCYPGSLDRIIKKHFHGMINLYGIGLSMSKQFSDAYLGKVYNRLDAVELDPLHPCNLSTQYPTAIPLDNCSIDAVIAGEILEHLYSPLHFLNEISRILKPGGHAIFTTPNISYIGNLVKLATGRSCHETLATSHIYLNSEWRAHIRIYDSLEIAKLCTSSDLLEVSVDFLDNGEDKLYKSPSIRRKMMLLKLFYIVPFYRPNLCLVYRKACGKEAPSANRY